MPAERGPGDERTATTTRARRIWKVVQRVWVTTGISLTVIFVAWSLIAYRAAPDARQALETDADVAVTRREGEWWFAPRVVPASDAAGLIFFPGSIVDPIAYAPLARAVAKSGFVAVIAELPRRGAFGGADAPEVVRRARAIARHAGAPARWVIGGHSRGAVIAAELASAGMPNLAGVVLIGTTHPRDVDLSSLEVPVTKIVGTRDGIAKLEKVEANRHLLPATTNWVTIEGGNHSQFGWYGFQPGDRRARIPAADQRAAMMRALIGALEEAAGNAADQASSSG